MLIFKANTEHNLKLLSSSTNNPSIPKLSAKDEMWEAGQIYQANQMFSHRIADATYDLEAPSEPIICESTGQLEVIWRRRFPTDELKMDHVPYSKTLIDLPKLGVQPTELVIIPQLPAFAHTEEIFPISYTFWNRSRRRTQDVTVYLDTEGQANTSADAIGYVWSGYKQLRVRIPPGAERVLRWNLYPVRGGRCKMPKLRVERGEAGAGGEVIAVMIGKDIWVKDRLAHVPSTAVTMSPETQSKSVAIRGPTEMEDAGILFVKPRREFSQE